MLPTAHKHVFMAVMAAFAGLLAAGPAHAAGPKLKAAYAVDSDRDGHVDGVSVTWSKKVRGGRDRKAPFAFSVPGYRLTRVDRAHGRSQRLHVAERAECDAGGSMAVRYSGSRGIRRSKIDMRRFDSPIPRITCAVTIDSDNDAHVDGVRVTYSRSVRSRAQSSGPFLFSVSGYRVRGVGAARGRFVRIAVAENAAADSGSTPSVAYSRPSGSAARPYAIRAAGRHDAFAGTFADTRDGVSPKLLSAQTGDSDHDGRLDLMKVHFSEPVGHVASGAFGVLGMKVRSATRLPDGAVSLSLVEGSARGDALPGTWVAEPGVSDASGNPALRGAVTPTDNAAPILVAAATQDTGGQPGHLDAVTVAFSESVQHDRDAGNAFPFVVGDRTIQSVETAGGRTVQIRLAEQPNADTDEHPPVRYLGAAGKLVTDRAGNRAVVGLVDSADAVAPVLLSAVTEDTDGDLEIDRLQLRFSENVRHTAEAAAGSFTVGGYQALQASAANGDQMSLTLTESGAPDTGARPSVSYHRDGKDDIADGAGMTVPDVTLAKADDGVRPQLVQATTADLDGDARIDRIDTTWSEPVVHAATTTAPFGVGPDEDGLDVAGVGAANGTHIPIDLVEPTSEDTGSAPGMSYSGYLDKIHDEAGLEPPLRNWTGLTVDALPPRLVDAVTIDADSDGKLDGLMLGFSENVTHAQEGPSASFGASGVTITNADAAVGRSITLDLQESGAGNTGLRPSVSYTPDGQNDVTDGAGNLAPAGTILQAIDTADPVLMSAVTEDTDDDGRLDRIATDWSEPIVHADDPTAPFPLSAEQLAVTRVRAASGQSLDVDLAEPTGLDTGSAPDLTYTLGNGGDILDAGGNTPGQRTYNGLTRDGIAPRLASTETSDSDNDGKLDGVDLVWSEDVTGTVASAPFAVSGRALGGSVNFNGPTTHVPFTEDPAQFDTDATPAVSYNAGPGDLHDVPEGAGDVADDAPAVSPQTPVDKAPPILVAAKTADLSTPGGSNSPNGVIDAVLATFSEPISHAVDGLAPFSLNVAGRTETNVEGDTGPNDRSLYITVNESGAPDGGDTPSVSVVAAGPVADHIKDRAATPNEARVMTFNGTADEVRPVLLSAQLGERAGGSCTKDAVSGIDGQVDCVLTTWSENVQHTADAVAPFSVSSDGWGIGAGGVGQLPSSKTLEIPLAPSGTPDRDRSGTTVSYDSSIDTPVVDSSPAGNEALDGTRAADPACRDTGREPNDSVGPGDPLVAPLSPAFERKCAFDDEWFRVTSGSNGHLEVATRPVSGVDIQLEITDGAGNPISGGTAEPGGAGQVDKITYPAGGPLAASTEYWAHVSADDATSPQEGPYCLVYSDDPATEASCGPLAGQVVFTEVGFGNDKFIEIKNDFDVPVEMEGANAKIVIGNAVKRQCTLTMPTVDANSIIEPDEHVVIAQTAGPDIFGCDQVSTLDPNGEDIMLEANGAIDSVPLQGVINSPVAAEHSLEFVESALDEDHQANDQVATRWCRTFAADSKGAAGDGCDDYRINEVLWRPASSGAASDGKAFVELAGNIPALANSQLLVGWVIRGVNGLTGNGTSDLVLAPDASPRSNGTYVVADGISGTTQVSTSDRIWDSLDLNSPSWPDGTGTSGPRGLQLLMPNPSSSPPCVGSADAFGWTTTAQGFTNPLDELRSCPGIEGQEYTNTSVGASAARDNLSSASDTTYNTSNDADQNRTDFCPQVSPNPGQLNIRPPC